MSTLSSSVLGYGLGFGIFTSICTILFTTLIVFSIKKLVHGLRAINYTPGLRIPFYPLDVPGAMLPTSWWNPGLDFLWLWRRHFYSKSETVSIIPFLRGPPTIFTSNLDVCRQVAAGGHKSDFIKDESASQALLIWGMNLLAAEGEVWRKHRRIVGPAFNNSLYQAVWTETIQTYHEMIAAEGWAAKKTVEIPKVQRLTYKLALLIIGRCGFGFNFNWDDPVVGKDGKPSMQESMRIVTDSFLTLLLPKWILRLPSKRLRRLGAAYDQVTSFMHTKVVEKRAELHAESDEGYAKETANAFNMLVHANEQEHSKIKLSDEELVGNIFILLFAGHETTAQTIAATFGFLSLYGDVQDEVLEQVIDVVGWDRDPSFEDYQQLNKVLAAFYEALRMFPAAYVLIREATKDTILTVPNPRGVEGNTSIPLLKGATVVVDMIGLQYNPRYFDDPFEYRPSRWYSITSESEAFSAFSVGPRACIGRKFATTEAVCFLTMVLRDWRIEPLLRDGETTEDWRARVMKPILALTLTLEHVPVRFVRRQRP